MFWVYEDCRVLCRCVQKVRNDRALLPRTFLVKSVCPEEHVYSVVRCDTFLPFLYTLEINKKIENPATCEVQSVIRFLNAKNVRPAEIHRQIVEVQGEGATN